jgi:hypothetical protein
LKRLWLDLGDFGDLVKPSGPHEQWQDHGLGLLRTILRDNGIETDLRSTRAVTSWSKLAKQLRGYDVLLMNVRSYTFPVALKSAQLFKQSNPDGVVLTGGMHATVAPDEMLAVDAFDHVCQGNGTGRQIYGRVADDRSQTVAQTYLAFAAQVPMAFGTPVWLGTGPGGHDPHEPRLPVAMCVL